jgi:hypothetical protein
MMDGLDARAYRKYAPDGLFVVRLTPPPRQFIYVLGSDGNVRGCKVGITGNPTARLKQLRSSSPCRLGFAFLATVENSAGAAVEREALGLLARHRTEGEWCRCPSQLAVAAVNWAAARQGLGLGAITDPAVADQILARLTAVEAAAVLGHRFDRRLAA